MLEFSTDFREFITQKEWPRCKLNFLVSKFSPKTVKLLNVRVYTLYCILKDPAFLQWFTLS